MKIATSFLAGVLFIGTMGAINSAMAEDGSVSKDGLTPSSYCHEKFPAISSRTLGDAQPVLKDASVGDMIDYYGPCGEDPRGKDQVEEQKLEELHQYFKE